MTAIRLAVACALALALTGCAPWANCQLHGVGCAPAPCAIQSGGCAT